MTRGAGRKRPFRALDDTSTDRYTLERLEPRILFSADLDIVGAVIAPSAEREWTRAANSRSGGEESERRTGDERRELIIVDAGVPDAERLVERLRAEAGAGTTVHLLESGKDSLARIGELVTSGESIDALHLISHGDDGLLQLGEETIDTGALLENAEELASWKAHLGSEADILVYGCDVAAGTDGERFVKTLAELTGADVAASDDVTGHASRGGDWELEHARGTIESQGIASAGVQDDWSGTLARVVHVSNTTAATQVQEITDSEAVGQTFVHSSGDGTYTINEIDLVLWRDGAAPAQTLNVTLRTAWGGSVLGSATIQSSALGTSEGWHTFGFADVELDDGVEYVIQVTTSVGGEKVYAGFDKVNGYADGDKIKKDGTTDSGKDLSFRIALGDPSLTAASYAANRDTYVDMGTPNTNYGGVSSLFIDRESTDQKAILVGFDISALPSNATIEAAYVDVELLDVGGDMEIEARQLVESWDESQATWNNRESGVSWGTMYGSTTLDSVQLTGGQTGTVSLDITALARDWHSGTATNHGVTILNLEGGGNREAEIGSREGANGPSLRIVYSVPPNTDPTVTSASSFAIDENATAVGAVAGDGADGDTLQYSIVGSADDSLFSIDASSGALTFDAAPDFETPTDGGADNDYDLTVQIDDGRGGIVTQAIRVTIRDVDEFGIDQVADTDATLDRVDEDASVGTTVGVDFLASDADGTDSVTYSLDNDAGGLFTIDATTGVVTVAGALDRETASFHSLTARATSTDGSFSTRSVDVIVGDVDEADVGATTDSDGAANSVAENATENDLVGVTASATDADATDDVTYSLTDNAGGRFQIDATTGVVTVASGASFDAETTASHDITVLSTSDDGSSSSETFTIAVTDVDEADVSATTDSDGTANSVAENASANDLAGVTASATDPDLTDGVTYSLTDDAGGRFQIDATTGVVTVASGAGFDAETTASHAITVLATSDDGSTSSETFTIAVTDVDEADVGATTDSDGTANAVAENASVNDLVGITASASDADVTDNVTYSLTDNAGSRFQIDATTGVVTVASGASFDAESAASHDITVLATSDDGSTSTETFTIAVTNVNEAPVITSASSVSVDENQTAALTVTSTDADGGTPIYSITGGADAARFAIDGATGELTFQTTPDFELPADADTDNVYEVVVEVSDGNGGTASQAIAVTVADADDASVISGTVTGAVTEGDVGDAPVTASGTLSITDPDDSDSPSFTDLGPTAGDNSYGSFALSSGTWTYTLDQSAVQALDAGDSVSDTITYTATDGSTQQVTVTISGTDDASVVSGTVTGTVAEGDVGDASVTASGALTISDVDGDDAPSFTDVGATAGENSYGSFTLSGGTWTYTLDQSAVQELDGGDSVSDTITYTATDGSTRQVTVTISGTDDASVVSGTVTETVAEGDVGDAPVTASGSIAISDVDGDDSPSFTDVGATDGDNAYGSFALSGGTWTYTLDQSAVQELDAGDSVSDTITYTATDGSTQQVTVTITGTDDASVVSGTVTGAVTEGDVGDTPVTASGALTVSDVDGDDAPSFVDVAATTGDNAYGSFELTSGTWTYTLDQSAVQDLDAGDSVFDTITYTATDGSTQQVTVTITGTDDASVVSGTVTGAVTEGDVGDAPVSASGTLSITDPDDSDSPSFTDLGPTAGDNAYGSFTLSGGTWTYTLDQSAVQELDAGDSVSDTITYTATDGSTQQVTVTISGTDDASVVSGTVIGAVTEGDVGDAPVSASGTLSITDSDDSDSPSFTDVGATAGDNSYGSFTLSGGTWTYTLDQSAVQALDASDSVGDTITYTATDGSTRQVTVTITGTDDASVVSGTVSGAVAEGDVGDATVSASGTLSITDPDDGDSPNFVDVGATTGDNSYGSFALSGGTWTYTLDQSAVQALDAGDSVSDTITYTATDGATQQVSVTITGTDDASVIGGTVTGTVTEGDVGDTPVSASGSIAISDIDGDDSPSFTDVGPTAGDNAYGSFELTGGTWTYTLDQSAVQALDASDSVSDTITYTATDGATQQVTVTISGTDDASVIGGTVTGAVTEGDAGDAPVSASGSIAISDIDGDDSPSFTDVGPTAGDNAYGSFELTGGTWTYTLDQSAVQELDAGDSVSDTITYTATDGSTQQVTVTISGTDDASVIGGTVTGAVAEGDVGDAPVSASGSIAISDIDGDDSPSFTDVGATTGDNAYGSFALSGGTWTYTLDQSAVQELDGGDSVSDTITYTATDGSTRQVTVTISGTDDASVVSGTVTETVAEGDVGDTTVTASGSIAISDVDGDDSPSFTDVGATDGDNAYGSFALSGGTWTYTLDQSAVQELDAGDSVSDTITYTATDGATQQVTVTITGTDDASMVSGTVTGAVTEGDVGDTPVTASGALTVSDVDGDDAPSFVDVAATTGDNAYGSFELTSGTWTYTLDQSAVQDLDAGDSVFDTITYTATDGSTQQVTVTISGTDDASVVSGTVTGAVTEGDVGDAPVSASGTLSITDSDDGDSPSFVDVGATTGDNAYGSFELTGGTWTYTLDQSAVQALDAGDSVSDTITYTATDGATQQVTVTITGTDDASMVSGTVTGAVTEGDVGDTPVTASGALTISDVDGDDAPSFTDVGATTGDNAYGSFALSGGTWTYTLDQSAVQALDAGDSVSDTITYTATDGATQQVSVTITGTDDASMVSGTVIGTATEGDVGDTPVTASGALTISDVDGDDTPSFVDVGPTAGDNSYGSFELSGGAWTYTLDQSAVQALDAGDSVSDTITYTATDGSTRQVTVTISGTDDASVVDGSDAPIGAVTDADATADTVAENAAGGTVVGVTAQATDPDSLDAVTYALTEDAGGRFVIDSATGVVTVDGAGPGLDHESASSYRVTVVAVSTDGSSTTGDFDIVVADETDEFTVSPIGDGDGRRDAVEENAAIGSAVGVTAEAFDLDPSDDVVFSLGDDAGGRFAIDAHSGKVTTARSLDHEAVDRHLIVIVAESSDGTSTSRSFEIEVENVNEAPTLETRELSLEAGGGMIVARDPDAGDTLSFSLVESDTSSFFSIDAGTGRLALADGVPAGTYELQIAVRDASGVVTLQMLRVRVVDDGAAPDLGAAEESDSRVAGAASPELASGPVVPAPGKILLDGVSEPVSEPIAGERGNAAAPTSERSEAAEVQDIAPVAVFSDSSPDIDAGGATGAHVAAHDADRPERDRLVIDFLMERFSDGAATLGEAAAALFDEMPDDVDLSTSLREALRSLRSELADLSEAEREEHRTVRLISATVGTAIAGGFVAWLLKSGVLAAATATTASMWRSFDPIPVTADTNGSDAQKNGEERDR